MSADSLKKVKIVVLGDTGECGRTRTHTQDEFTSTYNIYLSLYYLCASGVGKTSLVHVLCQGEVLSRSAWTVGCSVDVKVYTSIHSFLLCSVCVCNHYFVDHTHKDYTYCHNNYIHCNHIMLILRVCIVMY